MYKDKEELYEKLSTKNFLDFYNSFRSVKDLIEFITSRKRPEVRIFKLESKVDTEITAVIPIKSIESQNVKTLTKKLDGFNIIYVESSGPFFNFSYSMNVGIREAILLNTKYIMLSNDDIFPIESAEKLQRSVMQNGIAKDVLIPSIMNGLSFLSPKQKIFNQSWLIKRIVSNNILSHLNPSQISKLSRLYLGKIKMYNLPEILKYIIIRENDPLFDKNYLKLISHGMNLAITKFTIPLVEINNIQPISIIRSDLLKNEMFDEAFISGGEDTDFSVRLSIKGARVGYLKERFQNIGGYSMGNSIDRILKNTIPEILVLGYKLNQYFLQVNSSLFYK